MQRHTKRLIKQTSPFNAVRPPFNAFAELHMAVGVSSLYSALQPQAAVIDRTRRASAELALTGHRLTCLRCSICGSSAVAECLLGLLLDDCAPVVLAESVDHVLAPLVACTGRGATAAKLTWLWPQRVKPRGCSAGAASACSFSPMALRRVLQRLQMGAHVQRCI